MKELPDRWQDLGEFIREQRNTARLSLRRLSDMAGISNPYLSQIERGLRKPSAEILQQIAKALRISAETLYVRAGILEDHTAEQDLAGEILRDPMLTEEQKQTLLHIYLSFCRENGDRPVAPRLNRDGLRSDQDSAVTATGTATADVDHADIEAETAGAGASGPRPPDDQVPGAG